MPGMDRVFICLDCYIRFSVHQGTKLRKIPYCPGCGDDASVRTKKEHGNVWSEKDEKNLMTMYDQGLSPMQIAAKLGRTYGAILTKRKKLMKEKRNQSTDISELDNVAK